MVGCNVWLFAILCVSVCAVTTGTTAVDDLPGGALSLFDCEIGVNLTGRNGSMEAIHSDDKDYHLDATSVNHLPRSYLPFCVPPENSSDQELTCKSIETSILESLPVYTVNFEKANVTVSTHTFHFCIRDLCPDQQKMFLYPEEHEEDIYHLLTNGSLYLPVGMKIVNLTDYCLFIRPEKPEYAPIMCFNEDNINYEPYVAYGMIISIPFLVATFLVYTVIPELKNMHGITIRVYVGSLSVAYTCLAVVQTMSAQIDNTTCASLAFIIHFSFLASFFWLNVMCFDIWWTFGGFRALQGSVKQRERKKFILYSIYAWGCASLLTGICIAMDYIPGIPEEFITPEFGGMSCWFKTDAAKAIYFYGPMGATVVCNICLFIATALKIIQHKKDTAHHLKGTDSRRHDDNKQWFNLYLKLFIVMGINWAMEIISWLVEGPAYLWYITDLGNTLQGLIIFIIFVWKDKIKRLLLKRFSCRGRNFLSRDSMRSAYHSSAASRTCTTSVPLHEKSNSLDPTFRSKPTFDDSDGA